MLADCGATRPQRHFRTGAHQPRSVRKPSRRFGARQHSYLLRRDAKPTPGLERAPRNVSRSPVDWSRWGMPTRPAIASRRLKAQNAVQPTPMGQSPRQTNAAVQLDILGIRNILPAQPIRTEPQVKVLLNLLLSESELARDAGAFGATPAWEHTTPLRSHSCARHLRRRPAAELGARANCPWRRRHRTAVHGSKTSAGIRHPRRLHHPSQLRTDLRAPVCATSTSLVHRGAASVRTRPTSHGLPVLPKRTPTQAAHTCAFTHRRGAIT